MIDAEVAQRLKEAGLTWKPALGDRFAIPDRDLDEEVFVLSNMTIEVHAMPEGRVIGFNGTTEWALDDLEMDEAIWLPREDQLRELLGGTFRELRCEPDEYQVLIDLLGEERRFSDPSAESAYAAALLHLLAAAGVGD
ncbi:pilus assembly protein CpaE [Actinoplanes sp. TBRC 11911]|uniref:pilus assembly protein CpaE n=1 Tax=Actinoplanes sp. TBRC 11911 TaxID=2729386 RepID=UPI00145EB35D|nr:pilus assembly protein CpaE [Actinoplanes sp. TBRC 11911]NMO50493.1 pilus assembly protein CpaE [Actinoplanes sp. TBRC 11911]